MSTFKRALEELRAKGAAGDAKAAATAAKAQLVSFHSTSKGFIGECGLRGGYFELQNVPADVRVESRKRVIKDVDICVVVHGTGNRDALLLSPR